MWYYDTDIDFVVTNKLLISKCLMLYFSSRFWYYFLKIMGMILILKDALITKK